ncbi:MAG TPA: DinB family protein [Capsulimonadaceae bacterium]|jgi:hypothetical protein
MDNYIETCKERTSFALERFLIILSHVPADKLTWAPVPTAKSSLDIAAHCAGYSHAFANIIRDGQFPPTVDEFLGPIHAAIESITTVEEAETMLRKGIADAIAALDTVTPEQIDSIIDAPHAQMPFKFFLTISALHLENHGGQLDYLQTCWDDQDVHLSRA